MSLLQPQRETYNLFDDVMLLSDGETTIFGQVKQKQSELTNAGVAVAANAFVHMVKC